MATILVVDDERSSLWLLQQFLSDGGFEIVSTHDGEEAATLLQDPGKHFDLLLTDVVMPVVSGFELAQLAAARVPNLPVLFISGFSFDPLRPSLAASAFLQKPFSRSTLLRAVSALLSAPRSRPTQPPADANTLQAAIQEATAGRSS